MEAWRWDLIRDAFNVVLCIGVLLYLVHRRRAPEETADRQETPAFAQQIRLQALRQQSERSLSSILSVVESERIRLQQAFDADDRPARAAIEAPARAAADDAPFRLGDAGGPSAWGRHDGVHGLSREGLTCRQIAERLNLPRGEVELALKLRPAAG
ncbi:MAG: hypothetical protein MUE48_11970, partial [Desulfobacterales bacterium]|jgi:hypothetical protein|nr:hypothetical protein [Desulfobacterales bacterium]